MEGIRARKVVEREDKKSHARILEEEREYKENMKEYAVYLLGIFQEKIYVAGVCLIHCSCPHAARLLCESSMHRKCLTKQHVRHVQQGTNQKGKKATMSTCHLNSLFVCFCSLQEIENACQKEKVWEPERASTNGMSHVHVFVHCCRRRQRKGEVSGTSHSRHIRPATCPTMPHASPLPQV